MGPKFDEEQRKSGVFKAPFNVEPIAYCPVCSERVYAEYVDTGFGPYSVQADPYHCGACGWIETGCPADKCIEGKCHSWEICQGRAIDEPKVSKELA